LSTFFSCRTPPTRSPRLCSRVVVEELFIPEHGLNLWSPPVPCYFLTFFTSPNPVEGFPPAREGFMPRVFMFFFFFTPKFVTPTYGANLRGASWLCHIHPDSSSFVFPPSRSLLLNLALFSGFSRSFGRCSFIQARYEPTPFTDCSCRHTAVLFAAQQLLFSVVFFQLNILFLMLEFLDCFLFFLHTTQSWYLT